MATTPHSHGPNFGRRVDGCPRCAELTAGAPPVRWSCSEANRQAEIARRAREAHFAPDGPHARGTCGPVCTFGDW
jgi:hypothetical protein